MDEWAGHIRTMILAIQGVADPNERLERVVKAITDKDLGAAYQASIRAALASDVKLSGLLPQDHSDAVIRAFLVEVLAKL